MRCGCGDEMKGPTVPIGGVCRAGASGAAGAWFDIGGKGHVGSVDFIAAVSSYIFTISGSTASRL